MFLDKLLNNKSKEVFNNSTSEPEVLRRRDIEEKFKSACHELQQLPEFNFLEKIKQENSEAEIHIVGGFARDLILGKGSKDIDLVISKISVEQLAEILKKYGAIINEYTTQEQSFGNIKFQPNDSDMILDISLPRKDDYSDSQLKGIKTDVKAASDPDLNIIQDLHRRNFTANAIAVNFETGGIIDPFSGISDIKNKKIRCVDNPKESIVKKDMTRGLEAIRRACELNFKIEEETGEAIKRIFAPAEKSLEELYSDKPEILKQLLNHQEKIKKLFNYKESGNLPRLLQPYWREDINKDADKSKGKPKLRVAPQKINDEIIPALAANPKRCVEFLDEFGGLKVIMPEVNALKGVEQSSKYHSEGDALKHTLMLFNNLPADASLRLKLAALLHDTGKADVATKKEDGSISFSGHAVKSAEYVEKIGARLRWSTKLTKEVSWLVNHHMFPLDKDVEKIKPTKIKKIFLENEELGQELLTLSSADILASIPKEGEPNLKNIYILKQRIEEIKKAEELEKEKTSEKQVGQLLSGHDLKQLGLKQGKIYREVLDATEAARINNEISTKQEALNWIKEEYQDELNLT